MIDKWEISVIDQSASDLYSGNCIGDDEPPYAVPDGWEPFAYAAESGRVLIRRKAQQSAGGEG